MVKNENGSAMVKIMVIIGLFGFVIGIMLFVNNVKYDNYEIDLRAKYNAQLKSIESYYDKMWKTIKEQAGVTDKAKEAFKEIYIPLMEGRYSDGGGGLMKWVQEQNPQFDQSMYNQLMNTIESLRAGFHNEQKLIISITEQHERLLKRFPSKYFIGNDVKPLIYEVISSSRAKKVIDTRMDDELLIN